MGERHVGGDRTAPRAEEDVDLARAAHDDHIIKGPVVPWYRELESENFTVIESARTLPRGQPWKVRRKIFRKREIDSSNLERGQPSVEELVEHSEDVEIFTDVHSPGRGLEPGRTTVWGTKGGTSSPKGAASSPHAEFPHHHRHPPASVSILVGDLPGQQAEPWLVPQFDQYNAKFRSRSAEWWTQKVVDTAEPDSVWDHDPIREENQNVSVHPVYLSEGYDAVKDNYDNLHPNNGGHEKLARKWHEAIGRTGCLR